MKQTCGYVACAIALAFALISVGCTREMTSGDETPRQPFQMDRIPSLTQIGGQPSAGTTEGVGSTAGTEEVGVGETGQEDPHVAGLMTGGRLALANRDFEQAIDIFQQVLDLEPNHTGALYNIGYSYRQLGELDQALDYSRRAVESDPDRLYVHQNLGQVYEAQGNLPAATAEYEEELRRHPDVADLSSVAEKLAWVYLRQGLNEEAFDAAFRAINMQPDIAGHHAVLAEVHMANGAWDQAISAWQDAIRLAPDSGTNRKRLGDALWEAGRQDEARQAYQEAIARDPSLAEEIPAGRLQTPTEESDTGVDQPM